MNIRTIRRVVVFLALGPIVGVVGCKESETPKNHATEIKKTFGRATLRPAAESKPGGQP